MKSKRFEVLVNRPVNKDGYVKEWPEVGLIAMNSPLDPKPSIVIENGKVVELDGKKRENFDLLDYFIADYGIVLKNAEKVMAMDSLVIAKKLVDINITRDEILEITLSLTPAKMAEVIGKLTVLEMMMAGATAVEVGAANLVNPFACKEIIEGLPSAMEKYGIKDLNEIIGAAI